jgi:hypothetical protein
MDPAEGRAQALEQTNLLLIAAAPERKRGTGEDGEKGGIRLGSLN